MPERLKQWLDVAASRRISGRLRPHSGEWEMTAFYEGGYRTEVCTDPWGAALKLCWALIGQPNETAADLKQ